MKKLLTVLFSAILVCALAAAVSAADPLISIDFADGDNGMEFIEAGIESDPTRGDVLRVFGLGMGTNRQSYAVLNTDIFENNNFENGLTVSMWYKADISKTLRGTSPIFSLDIANVGYISVVSSLESAINTDGNDTSLGISPRCWNDPANVGGGLPQVAQGEWQQLTVVYSEDGMCIYVNGELFSEPIVNNGSMFDLLFQIEFVYGLRLGSWLCDWWNYGDFEGCFDEVFVYNTALSADEVKTLYDDTYIEQTVADAVVEEVVELDDTPLVDPVALYDFENGAGDFQLTEATVEADAVRGNALKLNGTGADTNGTSFALLESDIFANTDWSNGLTISLWCKADDSETLTGTAPLYSFDIANIGYIGFVSSHESGINTDGNEADTGVSPRCWNDPVSVSESPNKTPVGEWENIVVVYSPELMKIYVNGKLDHQNNVNGATMTDLLAQFKQVKSLRLGSWLCSWWNFGDYEGMIDDVALYNTALTPGQVDKLYNGVSADEAPAAEAPATETPATETPAADTPAPAPAPSTAPQTSDAAVVMFALCVMAFAAVVATRKLRVR